MSKKKTHHFKVTLVREDYQGILIGFTSINLDTNTESSEAHVMMLPSNVSLKDRDAISLLMEKKFEEDTKLGYRNVEVGDIL